MICAHSLRHRNIVKNGRPRNLFSRENPGIGTSQAGKIYESLLKNQTGRPYSAPYGGPHGVLLPFLTGDLFSLYHRCLSTSNCSGGRATPQIPNSATCSEYQRTAPVRKSYREKDWAEMESLMQAVIKKALIDFPTTRCFPH